MSAWITLGRGGIVDTRRILAVASARSAPVKRLLKRIEPERVVNLTYGYPRESVILLEEGWLVLVSLTIDQLSAQLESERIDPDEPTFK